MIRKSRKNQKRRCKNLCGRLLEPNVRGLGSSRGSREHTAHRQLHSYETQSTIQFGPRIRTNHDILRLAVININICDRLRPEDADLLEPMLTIAGAGGPMKTIPASASFSANVEFSLRKPYLHPRQRSVHGDKSIKAYPGCTAYPTFVMNEENGI
jgi:hypothetical protein